MVFCITLERMLIFFAIFLLGLFLAKKSVIRKEYLGDYAMLVTKVFLPVTVFTMMASSTTAQMIIDNLMLIPLSAAFYAAITAVLFLLAKLLRVPQDKDRVFMFSFMFGNTFFVAIPLFTALFPETGAMYIMVFSIVDQLVFWSFGVWLSTARDRLGGRKFSLAFVKQVVLSPNIIAMLLSFVFIFIDIKLPGPVLTALNMVSAPTSALGMIYLGALAGFSNSLSVLKRPELYVGIVVKMILLPVLAGKLLLLTALPTELVTAFVLIMALPVMTVVPMVATQNGNEGEYASGILEVTLVASVFTMPLVAFLVL